MATKDELMPLKKQSILHNVENQFSNFNLNQTDKCFYGSLVQSNSKSIFNNKSFGKLKYCSPSTTKNSKIIDDEKRSSRYWNKSTSKNLHPKPFQSITAFDQAEKAFKTKKWKNDSSNATTTKNGSTLSLHIAAYENLIEASSVESEDVTKQSSSSKSSVLAHEDSLEFPRQMKNNACTKPEVQQFKASQKLLNKQDPPPLSQHPKSGITVSTPLFSNIPHLGDTNRLVLSCPSAPAVDETFVDHQQLSSQDQLLRMPSQNPTNDNSNAAVLSSPDEIFSTRDQRNNTAPNLLESCSSAASSIPAPETKKMLKEKQKAVIAFSTAALFKRSHQIQAEAEKLKKKNEKKRNENNKK